jgi:protein-S-isoprenylcysteine O-methyltransferase Ste14
VFVIGTTTPPIVHGLLIATAIIWLVVELRQSRNTRPEAETADRGSRFSIRVFGIVGTVSAVLAKHVTATNIHPVSLWAWIGLVVVWCGIALRFWSFRTLGRYFTFTVQTSSDQPVITAGPYRVLRHPSYAGVLLAVIGIGLVFANWLSLVCLTVAILGGIVYRITVEERALLEAIGEPYRQYAATHKRLVPFVW